MKVKTNLLVFGFTRTKLFVFLCKSRLLIEHLAVWWSVTPRSCLADLSLRVIWRSIKTQSFKRRWDTLVDKHPRLLILCVFIFKFCESINNNSNKTKSHHYHHCQLLFWTKMLRLDLRAVLLLFCVVTCVSGMRREYFLKIEEVSWNYAPTGMNIIQNRSIQDDE